MSFLNCVSNSPESFYFLIQGVVNKLALHLLPCLSVPSRTPWDPVLPPHHMCTHTCTHEHMLTHEYTQARTHVHAHTQSTHMYMLTHMSTHEHMLTHEYLCTRTHTCSHTSTCTRTHMFSHTHAHTAPRPGGDGLDCYLGLTWPGCTERPPACALCKTASRPLESQPEGPCRKPSLLPRGE